MSDLDTRLLAAHEAGDSGQLVALYDEAADAAGTEDAERFYLTHAYVFALEVGDPRSAILRQRLVALGAEPEVS